jgi:hypothetical protein
VTAYAADPESVTGVEKDFGTERQAYLEGRWARAENQKKKDNPHLLPVFDTCVARTRGKYLIPLDIGSDWPDL